MNAGFSADVEALARHAEKFGSLADRVGEVQRTLRETLSSFDTVWGTDEVGRSFADGHVPPADATLSGLGALPEQLTDMGARFSAAAADYRAADETAAADLGRDES